MLVSKYFKDKNGSRAGNMAGDPTLVNLTITPGYTIASAFTLRGELRYDHASEAVLEPGRCWQEEPGHPGPKRFLQLLSLL